MSDMSLLSDGKKLAVVMGGTVYVVDGFFLTDFSVTMTSPGTVKLDMSIIGRNVAMKSPGDVLPDENVFKENAKRIDNDVKAKTLKRAIEF